MKWLLISILVCTNAHADTWLSFGGVSKHSKPGFTEVNWGFGIETTVPHGVTLGVGEYRNSLGQRSRYVGAEVPLLEFRHNSRISLAGGFVDGYPGGLQAFVAPTLVLDWRHFGLRAFGRPDYKGSPALVAVQFRVRIE